VNLKEILSTENRKSEHSFKDNQSKMLSTSEVGPGYKGNIAGGMAERFQRSFRENQEKSNQD